MQDDYSRSGIGTGRELGYRWRRRHRVIGLGILFLILLHPPLTMAAKQQVTADELNKFLAPYRAKGQEVTYEQLKKWFAEQGQGQGLSITPDLYPRLWPICVSYSQVMNLTHLNTKDSKLYQFNEVFKNIDGFHNTKELFYHFNNTKHSIAFNKEFVESLTLSRINPPEPDMINLRQWAHITVKCHGRLKGLYLQSLAGPAGLPLGEFNLDFPCSDFQQSADMMDVGELYPCHYRPKSSLYHPKVYVGYSPKLGKTEFHVNFQWTDITCMETPYLQFLIIAVKNFKINPEFGKDYQIIYSDVWLNTDFDSRDGSPYPYHPIWKNNMLCNAKSQADVISLLTKVGKKFPDKDKKNGDHKFEALKWNKSSTIYRIQPNEEYDACIRGTKRKDILDAMDHVRLECPPGPFKCSKSYQDAEKKKKNDPNDPDANLTVTQQREKLVKNEEDTTNCFPCAVPPCLELKFTKKHCMGEVEETPVIKHNDTVIIENIETVARSKSHGMLAILATMVFLPLANFMGRHFKEVCRNCLCGNGPWIFFHVIFHFISLIILWLSVGPVVASITAYDEVFIECSLIYKKKADAEECAMQKSVKNPHVPLGILVFIIQNLLIIFGFFRASSNKMRLIQLIVHSHLGYFTHILAAIAALVAVLDNDCIEIICFIAVLFITPIIYHIITIALDCVTDRRLSITPRRRQWPILEPVRLEKRGPCEPCKWCVFICLVVQLFATWIFVVWSNTASSRADPDKFDPDVPAGSVASSYGDVEFKGVFGTCGKLIDDKEKN